MMLCIIFFWGKNYINLSPMIFKGIKKSTGYNIKKEIFIFSF